MLLLKMFKAISFSKKERAILDFIWKAYLAYDGRYASFLYALMKKDPKETNYQLDLSDLKVKWIYTTNGTMGAFNPIFPSTIFIYCDSAKAIKLGLLKQASEYTETTKPLKYFVPSTTNMHNSEVLEYQNLQLQSFWILSVFPVIMHELYHMLQYKTSKVGYAAMRFLSIFTTLPYYLFQNASWMPAYHKWFSWDIEGQAEKYGNEAPNINKFCSDLESVYHVLIFNDMQTNFIEKAYKNGEYTDEEYKEVLFWLNDHRKNVEDAVGSTLTKYGHQLHDLILKLSKSE